ncbi:Frizzled-10 [Cichlidogyrus casuarinus]|uniref:Frizzled-10 n=1 Tax=Cichlidogyrus casuarinus TaxID=1844966 RepID=A0ABD2QGH6_9PLAT
MDLRLLLFLCLGLVNKAQTESGLCVPIRAPICQSMQYNLTQMPNFVGHLTQTDAERRMNEYRALIALECSRYFKFFLCTVYFPMCNPAKDRTLKLRPCQSFCSYVKSKCYPIVQNFADQWPEDLDCDTLPQSKTSMCIEPENYNLDSRPQLSSSSSSSSTTENAHKLPALETRACNQAQLKITTDVNQPTRCVYRCQADVFYRQSDKRLASVWLGVWASLCFFSCFVTLLVFLTDRARFKYPERPIIYILVCSQLQSTGFFLRVFLGAEKVSCRSRFELAFNGSVANVDLKSSELVPSAKFLISSGQENTWCTVNFVLVYFFGLAATIWWVALSVSWFLSSVRKWGSEGIRGVSKYFHLFAWPLPGLLTVVILIMHRIEADELTGMCYMGYESWYPLLYLSIIPNVLVLLLGLVLLAWGFCSIAAMRSDLKSSKRDPFFWSTGQKLSQYTERGNHVERLDKLVAKIGLISVMFVIPRACVLGVEIYHFVKRKTWIDTLYVAAQKRDCVTNVGLRWERYSHCVGNLPYPRPELSLLHVFMTCAVGMNLGFCVWCNRKSFKSLTQCSARKQAKALHPTTRNILSSSYVYAPPSQQSRLAYSFNKPRSKYLINL